LKNKDEYVKLGAQLPKGILLVGSPGVGKTLLSKAIAGEADCDFTYISSSSVEGRTIGQGAAKIREIFAKAKKSPGMTIIFFDEFDSIATKRSAMDEAWGRQTLNQLLSEMDGFDKHSNVFIIAATNFPQGLDPAVVRPGRFDKVISIPMPSFRSRKEIAQYYLSKIPASNDIDSEFIARNTINMSGADIKSLVNLAAMNAAKLSRSIVTKDDFEFAFDRIHVGIRAGSGVSLSALPLSFLSKKNICKARTKFSRRRMSEWAGEWPKRSFLETLKSQRAAGVISSRLRPTPIVWLYSTA